MRDEDDNIIGFRRTSPPEKPQAPKAINLPPVTKNIILVLAVIYALDWFVGATTGSRTIASFLAFYGLGSDPLSLMRLFTYSLVHFDLAHLGMNVVGIAVLGKVLEPALGRNKLIGVLALGSAAGAIVHIALGGHAILIGVSAGVGALYGVALPPAWQGYFGRFDKPIILLAMFFVITSVLGLVTGFMGGIAHAAHLGGFLAGLLLSPQLISRSKQF